MRPVRFAAPVLLLAMAAAAQGTAPAAAQVRVASLGNGIVVTGHVLPVAHDGRVVGTDIATQTRQALENLDAALKAHGASLERAASVHVYLRNAADFAGMNAAYAPMFREAPPARTTIVGEPALAEALIQVSAIGLTATAPREVVHPASWPKTQNPYSYGIKSGDTLFLAGLVSRRGQDNTNLEGDVATQTRVVLDNAEAILEAAGMGFGDVVSSRVFLTDAASFPQLNEAYRSRFPEPRPVRATVVCPLTAPAFKVEIAMVASRQPKRLVVPPLEDGSPGIPGPNFSPALGLVDRGYLSGVMGNSAANRGDARGQARVALAALGRGLKALGASWSDVSDATLYVTSMKDAEAVQQVFRETAGRDDVPVVVAGVGLVLADAAVEVMVTTRVAPRR